MITFLPYPDFKKSASCLDDKRLNKQIIEAYQIHNIVSGKRTSGGWINHPATRMWTGYADALALYLNACIEEWINVRKHSHSIQKIHIDNEKNVEMPHWFGDEMLHASHRSSLLGKDPEFYGKYGWTEDPFMPYVWPGGKKLVKVENKDKIIHGKNEKVEDKTENKISDYDDIITIKKEDLEKMRKK